VSAKQSYRAHLDLHITPLIGKTKLSALTVPFVREFEDRLRVDRSAALTKAILISLSSILSDAQERGLVAQNVLRGRRAKNGNERAERHVEVGKEFPSLPRSGASRVVFRAWRGLC
jgi:hypothetical protein